MSRQEPVWVSVVNLMSGSKGPSGAESSTTTPPKSASDFAKHAATGSAPHWSSGGRHKARKHPMSAEASHGGDLGHLLCTPSSIGSLPSDVSQLRVYESPAALSTAERRSSAHGAANAALEGVVCGPARTSTSGSETDATAQTAFERKLAAAGSGQKGMPVTSGTSLLGMSETGSALQNTSDTLKRPNDPSWGINLQDGTSIAAADGKHGGGAAPSSASKASQVVTHSSRKSEDGKAGEARDAASSTPDDSASIIAPYQNQQSGSSDDPPSHLHEEPTSHLVRQSPSSAC